MISTNNILRGLSMLSLLAVTSAFGQDAHKSPADRFVELLPTRANVPAGAVDLIRNEWEKCKDCDGEEFLTQGLAVLSPEFREGLEAYEDDRYAEAIARMAELRKSDDPFIATNAAVYEIKAMVAVDQMVEAGDLIKGLLGKPGQIDSYSYFAAEVAFLNGYCALADLRYQDAANALQMFLMQYPDAPQRLNISAKQILAELSNRTSDKMTDVVDLMQYSHRRLKNADGSEIVQSRQKRIVDLLDDMIKEAEDQEKQACENPQEQGGQQQQQQRQQGQSGQQMPSTPMQDSSLPGGDPTGGNLRDARRANPGEMWGQMPPGERERILQALRDSFPTRYRKLVEQYYEELAKKP